jgi:undecaprenyl diphosphate synthase
MSDSKSTDPRAATWLPRHIAVIMDGNGRWAKARHMPRLEGHRAGAKTVRMVVEECRKLGVRHLTLFTFSTENIKSPTRAISLPYIISLWFLSKNFDNAIKPAWFLLYKISRINLISIYNKNKIFKTIINGIYSTQFSTI